MLRGSEFEPTFLEFEDGIPAEQYMVSLGPAGEAEPFPPHLILVDINMPVLDGYSFVERITPTLKSGKYGTVVVMMMSSSSRKEDIDRALSMEAVEDYIVKGSLEPEAFQSKVRELLKV